MLPPNPFLGGFAPSIEQTGVRPQGPSDDAVRSLLAERMQRELETAALNQQYQELRNRSIGAGMQLGGYGAGMALRPVLRPAAQAARTAVTNLFSYSKSEAVPVGARAINGGQNVLFGSAEPVTAGGAVAPAAAAAPASAAPAATAPTADLGPSAGAAVGTDGASLLGSLGQLLSVAGLGYNAYAGIQRGQKTLHGLSEYERAFRGGELDQGTLDRQRAAAFRSGMVDQGIGSATGLVAGSSLGPLGMIAGAVAGGAGGAMTASRAYKDSDHPAADTGKALVRFMGNPFRH